MFLIEIVLEALPEDYNLVVVFVSSKEDLCSLDELESFLLARVMCLEKNKRPLAVVNLA